MPFGQRLVTQMRQVHHESDWSVSTVNNQPIRELLSSKNKFAAPGKAAYTICSKPLLLGYKCAHLATSQRSNDRKNAAIEQANTTDYIDSYGILTDQSK